MLASEQVRDFWKKCEMRPKWRCLMQRNMFGKTKTQHINENTSQQLSGTVESGVVIVCRELCINANLRTSMNWNNTLKKSAPIPPQWCEVLQKTILQIIETVALQSTWSESILCVLYTSFKAKTCLFTSLYLHMKQCTALLLDWIYSELIILNWFHRHNYNHYFVTPDTHFKIISNIMSCKSAQRP